MEAVVQRHLGSANAATLDVSPDVGDFLTRAWVWLALLGYGISTIVLLLRRETRLARWVWGLAAIAFVVHVACAFHFFHSWSHEAAFVETARQTKELTGFDSGSGLYLNYVFTLIWIADAVWWYVVGDARYLLRSKWLVVALHGFFLFMIVNGTIVFGRGPVRAFGAVLVAAIGVAISYRLRSKSANAP